MAKEYLGFRGYLGAQTATVYTYKKDDADDTIRIASFALSNEKVYDRAKFATAFEKLDAITLQQGFSIFKAQFSERQTNTGMVIDMRFSTVESKTDFGLKFLFPLLEYKPTSATSFVFGMCDEGVIQFDFTKTRHSIFAGETGGGKSN